MLAGDEQRVQPVNQRELRGKNRDEKQRSPAGAQAVWTEK
jgi:hypothetical protein